jgi:predicted nucleic acid-binding protein
MSGELPAVYWDTCVFLAWVMNEDRAPEEKAGIEQCIDDVRSGRLNLVTSTITRVEVLACKTADPGQAAQFAQLLLRPEVIMVGVDRRIADSAHDIRDHYQRLVGAGESKPLATPDAIHLATAVQYDVTQLQTFDDGRNSKFLGLLSLNGDVAGNPLAILKPGAIQLRLT